MLALTHPLLRPLPSRMVPTIAACSASHVTQNLLWNPLAASTSITRNASVAASYAARGLKWPHLRNKLKKNACLITDVDGIPLLIQWAPRKIYNNKRRMLLQRWNCSITKLAGCTWAPLSMSINNMTKWCQRTARCQSDRAIDKSMSIHQHR